MKYASVCLIAAWMSFAACKSSEEKKPPPPLSSGAQVSVVKIVKGDELMVEKDSHQYRLRMLGIDAFRKFLPNEDFAKMHDKVTQHLKQTILNQKVKIVFGKTVIDEHGRYLAYVEKDGVDMNRKLVEDGYVLVYNKYSFSREQSYVETEQKARKSKNNIWSVDRLVNVALIRRKVWAESRKEREGSVPDYYLAIPARQLEAPTESPEKTEKEAVDPP
jgi:micrococcal nuclease